MATKILRLKGDPHRKCGGWMDGCVFLDYAEMWNGVLRTE